MVISQKILDELESIEQDCSYPGWDGYDAVQLTEETIIVVKEFLKLLPDDLSVFYNYDGSKECKFDLIPESDGDICIEWYIDRDNQFSISIGSNKEINYAGIINKIGMHDSVKFENLKSLKSIFKIIQELKK